MEGNAQQARREKLNRRLRREFVAGAEIIVGIARTSSWVAARVAGHG
jgi:hypothetical protein